MPLIVTRIPRTRQPQGEVDLDPRWGLKPALVFAPSIGAGWVYGSSLSSSAGQPGRSVVFPGGTQTSANVATKSGGVTTAQTKCTFVCVARLTSPAPYAALAGLKYSASNQGLYLGDTLGLGNDVGIIKGGVAALSSVPLSIGATYVIVASHRQDTGEYYVLARDVATNQVLRNSQTDTRASTAGNGTYCVGSARSDGVTGSFAGDIYLSFGSFDWLQESSGRQLLANPWQLFAPIERRIWVPGEAPGGVPSITAVYAENITATSADYRVTLDYA